MIRPGSKYGRKKQYTKKPSLNELSRSVSGARGLAFASQSLIADTFVLDLMHQPEMNDIK